ncbi:phthiocerol/phthiodiolone dimycocerosyl transferase family protein [Segniliparus rotundus]|uniref:phthiocerol/phthiodiolone dimycocerosyl transferase family protein n=1 Tax=Segniliparus rotundus TaxID=286802 RepID=UPI00165134DE|nr:hypothetical protein [Segniliparus rotundus]
MDTAALLRAFGRLREEFPLLAGRVLAVDDGFDFVVDESCKAPQDVVRLLRAKPGTQVPPNLNPSSSLATLDVVTYDEDWHCVTPWCNHAAADGRLWLFLVQRLWSLYTQEADGAPESSLLPDAGRFPGAMEYLLAQRNIREGSITGEERLRGARWSGSPPRAGAMLAENFQLQSTRLQLNERLTTDLRALAARRSISMHGVVAGAVALAERAAFVDVPEGEPVPMAFISPVEMRARVVPPIAIDEVTNFMGTAYTQLEVSCENKLLELGKTLSDQLIADLKDGLILGAMASPTLPERGGVGVVLNNIGVIPSPSLPENLIAEDVAWSFYVEPGQMRSVLESMPKDAEVPMEVGSIYYFYSFCGMLNIDLMHMPGCASEQARKSLVRRVIQLLVETAQIKEVC